MIGVYTVRSADDGIADVLDEVVTLVAEHFVMKGDGGVGGGRGADIGARAETGVDERRCAGGICGVACGSAVGIGIVGTNADSVNGIADFVNVEVAEKIERFLI